jgi:hypothetical protein
VKFMKFTMSAEIPEAAAGPGGRMLFARIFAAYDRGKGERA